jgi:hypothetical protein
MEKAADNCSRSESGRSVISPKLRARCLYIQAEICRPLYGFWPISSKSRTISSVLIPSKQGIVFEEAEYIWLEGCALPGFIFRKCSPKNTKSISA